MFPRIYEDIPCPIDGYSRSDGTALTITLLANPTFAERQAWSRATLETPGCEACAALKESPLPPIDVTIEREFPATYCESCSAARHAFGQSAAIIFKAIGDCDLTTPAACVAAFESGVPEELLPWVYGAPYLLWAARADEIKKKLTLASLNGISSTDSEAVPSLTT